MTKIFRTPPPTSPQVVYNDRSLNWGYTFKTIASVNVWHVKRWMVGMRTPIFFSFVSTLSFRGLCDRMLTDTCHRKLYHNNWKIMGLRIATMSVTYTNYECFKFVYSILPNLSHLFLAFLLCLRFRGISCSILMLQMLCVRLESLFLIFTRWPMLGLKAPLIPCTTTINHWSRQLQLWSDFLLKHQWDNRVLLCCLIYREKNRIELLSSLREDHCFS